MSVPTDCCPCKELRIEKCVLVGLWTTFALKIVIGVALIVGGSILLKEGKSVDRKTASYVVGVVLAILGSVLVVSSVGSGSIAIMLEKGVFKVPDVSTACKYCGC